jgi:hypothetical protein
LFAGGGGLLAGGGLFADDRVLAGAAAVTADDVVGPGLDVVAEVRTGVVDDVRVGLATDDGADLDGCLISVD